MENPKTPPGSTPADKAIAAFGGVRATARAAKRNGSSVSRWRKPIEEGGTGGRVPSSVQETLLLEARKRGIDLTAEDLIVRTSTD
ncbi:MAG: hypothetical protein K0Q92_640 [Steroidobacteraceae bacterium]|jgi:hypothetical protein|nr:hypothetical protein [Steroidobacteraceae bacterium]